MLLMGIRGCRNTLTPLNYCNMAKAGYTTTDCPGCGGNTERKKNKLCVQCFGLLETGRNHIKSFENSIGVNSMIEVSIPTAWDGPRYSAYKTNSHSEFPDLIRKSLREIASFLSVPKGDRPQWGYIQYLENRLVFEPISEYGGGLPSVFKPGKDNFGNNEQYEHCRNALIHKDVLQVLNLLHLSIEDYISETEKKAVEYGTNALFQLNNGTLTMDDFNEKIK